MNTPTVTAGRSQSRLDSRWNGNPLRSPLLPDGPAVPVRMFVAYDDRDAARRAMELLAQLTAGCGGTVDLLPGFWRCDVLDDDACRESAADEAEAADVIVIAMSQAETSSEIGVWLERVLVRRAACSVAIVVLIPDSPGPATCRNERPGALAAIAARHGADFFANLASHELTIPTA